MSTIARHDGWRGSGCSLAGTTLALGESKTLKQRRCAACGGMHVDGERSSPKNGSNLAGKCPPPPQAAGHLTLRDRLTSNGTSAPHCGESISYDTDRLPTLHHGTKCLKPFDFKVEYMHLSADQEQECHTSVDPQTQSAHGAQH